MKFKKGYLALGILFVGFTAALIPLAINNVDFTYGRKELSGDATTYGFEIPEKVTLKQNYSDQMYGSYTYKVYSYSDSSYHLDNGKTSFSLNYIKKTTEDKNYKFSFMDEYNQAMDDKNLSIRDHLTLDYLKGTDVETEYLEHGFNYYFLVNDISKKNLTCFQIRNRLNLVPDQLLSDVEQDLSVTLVTEETYLSDCSLPTFNGDGDYRIAVKLSSDSLNSVLASPKMKSVSEINDVEKTFYLDPLKKTLDYLPEQFSLEDECYYYLYNEQQKEDPYTPLTQTASYDYHSLFVDKDKSTAFYYEYHS